ncbi:MAG: magnesium transporter [Gemmatimonadaceae bacterium]
MANNATERPGGRPIPELLYLLHADPAELEAAIAGLRAADLAEALSSLSPDAGAKILAVLPFDFAVQILDEPDISYRRCDIIQRMDPTVAGALIDAMSADQQADLFRELPEKKRPRLLSLLEQPTRDSLTFLLRYPPQTAGGIMTTEFVSLPITATVEEALRLVSTVGGTKETIYTIYCVDPQTNVLVHVVSLRDVLLAERSTKIIDVGNRRKPLSVPTSMDREEVARIISKYNLLAIPVVDEASHILGIVTVDDVIDAIVRESTEDAQKFGGMEALDEPYSQISFRAMIKKRAGWLCALFLSEMLTATAMQHFEGEISKAVVLSMFIPLVMSSGGNSGSQATSLIIRALALREIKVSDWWRIALRELPTGLTLGLILGIIGFARIEIWQHLGLFNYGQYHVLVATTVGAALIGIVGFGSLAGSMLPFLMKRVGFDPASASAPFVATLVDVTGLIIYFSVAFLILRNTLLK